MNETKMPVMTRRGIVYCEVSADGYVTLPNWVEGNNLNHGPHLTMLDVQEIVRNTLKNKTIVVDDDDKPVEPDDGKYNAPHEIKHVVSNGKFMCRGGVDSRPSAEVLAKAISERDKMRDSVISERNKYLSELTKERAKVVLRQEERDEERTKVACLAAQVDAERETVKRLVREREEARADYNRRIKVAYTDLDILRQRLRNVRIAASGRATEAAMG